MILGGSGPSLHAARDLAIGLSPHQDRIFRFRFLSLVGSGVATAFLLILALWGVFSIPWLAGRVVVTVLPFDIGWFLVGLLVALCFVDRGFYFKSITLRVPLSMAAVTLAKGDLEPSETGRLCRLEEPSSRTILYLAGGFRSGWQDWVAVAWRGRLIDPRRHRHRRTDSYTLWDLEAIRASDWLLAYLEDTNPGGYALALEVGFAKALGKRIILVDEKSAVDEVAARYLAMVRATADLTFENLEEAVQFLASWDVEEQDGG